MFGTFAIPRSDDMSPSDQWNHVAAQIDRLAEETSRQFDLMRQQQKDDRHALRNELQSVVGRVSTEFADLRKELVGVDKRTLVMETEKKIEADLSLKRATWVSVGIGLAWSVFQFLFGWYSKK